MKIHNNRFMLSCFLAVLMIASIFLPSVTVYANEPVLLTVSNPAGTEGTDVIVSVEISADSRLGAATLLLKYDTTKLTCKSAVSGNAAAGSAGIINKSFFVQYGFLTINDSFAADESISAAGSLLDITFTVKPGWIGTAPVTLLVDGFYNGDTYKPMIPVITNGSVISLSTNSSTLNVKNGSTTVIDTSGNFIYGLRQCLTQAEFESGFVKVPDNARLVCTLANGSFGTGTKVELVGKSTNEVIQYFYIVIFGDINGDSIVDINDEGMLIDMQNYVYTDLDPVRLAVSNKAGDVFHDGVLDENDAAVMVDSVNNALQISQSTSLAS